ncbi:MAG: cyclic pyranopterin monophosphate synthase MoaC [Coriobacteriia bacterium]|nr:cyclic pyranopterin monophosphate synthase MoaC [Coriobacteriia bacterium]MCL2746560.1 cyclic pyranopterin monophosphate synthase MoaC [Coriobacteriia bacterium]MCL2870703.1 cyclic pyranopterin monophosphate synthase MoaC [Coriobacteriia bacterium]
MFTHLNSKRQAQMVDIKEKSSSYRTAIASSFIQMDVETLDAIRSDTLKKGDVLATARIAGIQAAKRCSELIPLCHPLLISKVAIDFEFDVGEKQIPATCGILCLATVSLVGQTGVEMEALTAASVAALTIFDMAKAVDKNMSIESTRLEYKSGGNSGTFTAGKAGTVLSVNLSKKKGEQKLCTLETVDFIRGYGIEGDAHAGDWHRQVSLLDQSSVDQLIAKGLKLEHGDFAENITTSGFKLQTLPVGSKLRVGQALLEITQIGKECHTRCAIYQQAGDCVMPRDGIFAAVIEGGKVKAGDTMYLQERGL